MPWKPSLWVIPQGPGHACTPALIWTSVSLLRARPPAPPGGSLRGHPGQPGLQLSQAPHGSGGGRPNPTGSAPWDVVRAPWGQLRFPGLGSEQAFDPVPSAPLSVLICTVGSRTCHAACPPHRAVGRTEEGRIQMGRCSVHGHRTGEPQVFILLLLLNIYFFLLVIEIVFTSKAQQTGKNPAGRFQRVKSSPGGKKMSNCVFIARDASLWVLSAAGSPRGSSRRPVLRASGTARAGQAQVLTPGSGSEDQ